jgi:hypothetical protein
MSKSESKLLTTTAEVIDALGAQRVSELTGKSYKRVWDWGADGQFPSRYFAAMWLELVAVGFLASPRLWGQDLGRRSESLLLQVARGVRADAVKLAQVDTMRTSVQLRGSSAQRRIRRKA